MRELDDTGEQDKIQQGLINEHIRSLVVQLTCADVPACQRARRDLVAIGKSAVPALIGVMEHPDARVRWEAAKALGHIGDARPVPALVKGLEDKEFDVRWVAAEALTNLGRAAVPAVLQALAKHPESVWLREGAGLVFKSLLGSDIDEVIRPLVDALKGQQPVVELPPLVRAAQDKLSKSQ